MGGLLTQAWRSLEDRVRDEFAKSGYGSDQVEFTHMVRMQYYGQLVDIEVDAPTPIESIEDVNELIATFETTYTRMYARAASSPELGYLVAQAIVKGSVPIEQPTLPTLAAIRRAAGKGTTRLIARRPATTDIYDDNIHDGHDDRRPAVLEAESTTFPIPTDRHARLNSTASSTWGARSLEPSPR